MIKPCPCGHTHCKSYIAPPLINCACNSLNKRQATLIDSAEHLLGVLVVAQAAITDLLIQHGDPTGKMRAASALIDRAIDQSQGDTQ